jgi:O-antigen/teichoic acid export membrane protein
VRPYRLSILAAVADDPASARAADAARPVEPAEIAATVTGRRAGFLVFIGIGTTNLGNAVFHLFSGRLLGPSRYGEVVSLVAVSGLIALPFGGVQYAVARFVADDAARRNADGIAAFVRRAMTVAVFVAATVAAIVTLASPLIRDALGVTKLSPVVLMALYTFPALLAPPLWGVAQGLQRFGLMSASMIVGSVARIVVLVALIPLGVGVGAVMGATLVGGCLAIVVPLPLILWWMRRPTHGARGPATGEVLRYMVPVVVGTLAITSLTTLDLIVAKVSLSSHDAGIYGSASFIGRLLLYLPMTIATVLLPKVISRAALELDTKEILHASLAVTAAFSLVGTGLLIVLPRLIVEVTFGAEYSGATPLVGVFGLTMTVYALLNVQLAYHLGHGRTTMAWLLLAGAVAQVLLYVAVHGSTYQLVTANLVSALAVLLIHELLFESTIPQTVQWGLARIRRQA